MFSSKENVLETVALLKAHGISDIVLSPGSRNAPLIQSFASEPFFRCHSVVDERSAGFFALGLIQETQKPVAVCCTSGTALLNYGPAVAEAFYQGLPLVVISADRSPAWIGQMDGQTLPQPGIFGPLVRKSVQLLEICTEEDRWLVNRLVNEALNASTLHGFGPVHINLPISEPLFDFSVQELPVVRQIKAVAGNVLPDVGAFASTFIQAHRPMIVIGQRLPDSTELSALLERFSEDFGVVVLAEHLSNVTAPCAIGSFDALLALEERKARTKPESTAEPLPENYTLAENPTLPENHPLAPDLLITLGGHIVSKRLKHFMRTNKQEHHWHLSESGSMPDLYQGLTDSIQAEPVLFLQSLLKALLKIILVINKNNNKLSSDELAFLKIAETERTAFSTAWKNRSGRILNALSLPFSDILVTRALMNVLPENSTLFVGNSSSVRNIQLFNLPAGCKVFCNRGTSGIEGTLSSACGYASVSKSLVFVELGDLSFFYDLNSLIHKPFPANLRILLPNNGGGGIFHVLNGLEKTEAFDRFMTARHDLEAREWVKAAGLQYLRVGSPDPEEDVAGTYWPEEGLTEAMAELVRPDWKQAVLLEVKTSAEAGKEAFESYLNAIEPLDTKNYG
jgi:2-succinyl-5-enolpyruvyl-6-hydroxy-3-cyclohexene-1-carboxylate synthase